MNETFWCHGAFKASNYFQNKLHNVNGGYLKKKMYNLSRGVGMKLQVQGYLCKTQKKHTFTVQEVGELM